MFFPITIRMIYGWSYMTDLQQYNDAFRAFLASLNPAQRRAVDTTEGPVLVIAGPGTGKTHILTARIGNILLNTDAKAQNVLCLTFTDAGVHAMRRRLLERIGPEAHRVPIFTFHAFCNRVIQENMEHFGKGNLEPITELERIEIVRNLLAKLPPGHPLREGRKDTYQYEAHLRDVFATMKKEGWSPGFVLRRTDEFLAGLPSNPDFMYQRNGKNFKKGDPKTAQIEETTEKLTRLKAAADIFPKYVAAMERAGRYEYEDMLLWVTKAFEKNEALLRTYQERYQYLLVDEFQDTNGAQFHLLNLLLDFWEVPNVFIVGDDDQSIYEFQGARLENLREFYKKYQKGLETIVLEENYRSTQALLDAAKRVIDNNELRALYLFEKPLEKRLKTASAEDGNPPRIAVYETKLHEVADIVAQIEHLVKKDGVPPSEIAVIYARHRQAERLLSLLEKKGIPYQTKRPVNILDLPIIRQFREFLKYLHEEAQHPFSGEHRLFRLLHAAWFGLEPLDLAKIAIACHPARTGDGGEGRYERVGQAQETRLHWREALSAPSWLNRLSLSHPAVLSDLSQRLEGWITDVSNLPLSHLIERLYAQTGLLHWALRQSDKVLCLQILSTFMDFVKAESSRSPRFSLARLLTLLDSMDDNDLPLPLQQPIQSGPGVQLLTAHAAKGLEFEHVFMLDCTDDAWEKNGSGHRGRFALPPTLTRSGAEDEMEARRRLFYVGMTRAKRALHLSFARTGDDGKPLAQARFVDETALPHATLHVPPSLLTETQTLLLLEPTRPVVTLPEPTLLDELLAHFSLSITAFNRYLRCPLAFYYEDLLKVPGTSSEAAAFGMAMHGALQQFLLKMKNHKKMEWPSPENLQRLFDQEMERQRGWFSEHGFAQRLTLGKDYLRRIHLEQVPFWKKRAIVERRIDRVELNGVPLTGVLDKIEWLDGGSLRIVDYKTGTPDLRKTTPPDARQALGGEYWRQLAFYKILLENARIYPERVGRTAISWLEPDKRGAFPITEISFSGEEIHFVEEMIREVYSKIQNRAFADGCGDPSCAWCRMHHDGTAATLSERGVEEGLDDGA
ncbi:MAG: ATP-dependent helicase [Saprospiraceae bacterium]|nr:ATP-dependent helicase [Saprospiraceae bacterium]